MHGPQNVKFSLMLWAPKSSWYPSSL